MPNWISVVAGGDQDDGWDVITEQVLQVRHVAWLAGDQDLEVVPDLSALSLILLPPSQHFTFTSTICVRILQTNPGLDMEIYVSYSQTNADIFLFLIVCIKLNCQEMAALSASVWPAGVTIGMRPCCNYHTWQLWRYDAYTWQLWHCDTYMTLWQQPTGQWSYLHMTGTSIWL